MSERPNILFLLTDMQRADTVSALGNPVIRTPNLDRLVREGTSFERCYTPSPVCVPARCCLHYGQYPTRTGLAENGNMCEDSGRSYPAVLGEAGYRTHAVGKCHWTPDRGALRGFGSRRSQEEVTSDPEVDDYVRWLRDHGHDYYEPHGARGEMYYIPQVSPYPEEAHPSGWIGSESIQFIREAREGGQPWLLKASFIHPHPPFAPPKPWHKLYRTPDMELPFLPEDFEQFQTWINRYQNRYKYRDRGLDLNLIRTIKAYYYATISFVDYQVGRILEELERGGELDNTLIVFTSDHGELLGDFGCFGKRSMHEASARVPMLVRHPGRFPAGHRSRTAVSLVDLYPTFLGAAGVEKPDGAVLDGGDLAGFAACEDPNRIVYSQHGHGNGAIFMAADARYKYIRSVGESLEFAVDLEVDPSESDPASVNPDHLPEGVARLEQWLRSELAQFGGEFVEVRAEGSRWRPLPPVDESWRSDPDARLIRQDYPSYPFHRPGYTD